MSLRNKKLILTVQIILGLSLIFFGLNLFFQFFGLPPFNEAGTNYLGALFATGFIFPIMGTVMLLTGILFVLNKCSPLATIILFPISLNIILFHIFLDSSGWITASVIFILNIYLIYVNFDAYKPLCKKPKPK